MIGTKNTNKLLYHQTNKQTNNRQEEYGELWCHTSWLLTRVLALESAAETVESSDSFLRTFPA